MKNYQIIKSYLETFPDNITVKEMLDNIEVSEKALENNLKTQEANMSKNIGKVYFYRDEDDCPQSEKTKCVTRLIGTERYDGKVYYRSDMLEMSDGVIYNITDVRTSDEDLKGCKEINPSLFDMLLEKFNEMQGTDF